MTWINEKTARAFGVNINTNFTGVFALILFSLPFVIGIGYTLYFDQLTQDRKKREKYGMFLANLNTFRNGKTVILYPVFTIRKIVFSFTLVFLQEFPNFSIFSINFQILSMIILIGLTKPFKKPRKNTLEILNEFSLLVVNYHLMSLTDWVFDADTRDAVGWSMIAVTTLGIAVNLVVLGRENYMLTKRKYRFWQLKRAVEKRNQEYEELEK